MMVYANTAYQTNTGSVVSFPGRESIRITEPTSGWRHIVVARLEKLIRLSWGWDGYGGLPVSLVNVTFALRMLEAACRVDAPAPEIVPGPDGDLQIEWHTPQADIELHVRGPNDVNAWRMTQQTGADGEEIALTTDFTVVAQWIRNLAEPNVATGSAAA